MAESQRFPRMRIQESDFPLQLPDEFTETFLEVVDSDGNVVALFCLIDGIENKAFSSLAEFSQNYDGLFFNRREDDNWIPKTNIEGCRYLDCDTKMAYSGIFYRSETNIEGSYCVTPDTITQKDLDISRLVKGLSAYGRLQFTFGLDNAHLRKMWEGFLSVDFLVDILRYALSEQYERYRTDILKIFHFLFDFWGVSGTHNRFRRIFSSAQFHERIFVVAIDAFVKLDLSIIETMACVLFAEDNIDFFIEESARTNLRCLEEYLKDFKRKYIGDKLDGYPRFRFLEKDFPEKFPPGANSSLVLIGQNENVLREPNPFYMESPFFIDLINDAGDTVALFHVSENFTSIFMWDHPRNLNISWFPDKLAFIRYFDEFSAVGYDRQEESYYEILMDINSEYLEDYESKMRQHKVSSKQEYCDLAEITDVGGDIQSIGTNNALIDYGRLKYPYFLDEQYRSQYVTHLEEDINELFYEIEEECDETITEKVAILKFLLDYYKKESASYKKFIEELLVTILYRFENKKIIFFFEHIFHNEVNEVIALLMDVAHDKQNTEVLAYLLDFQNKHFPPEGTSGLKLDF